MSNDPCLGCGASLSPPFLDLGLAPLANSYPRPGEAGEVEFFAPLAVCFCPACYLVQLDHLVSPEAMFSDYLYLSSYSDSYLVHADRMSRSLVDRFRLTSSSQVLEIASNDGYLLQYFKKRSIPALGIEPARNIAAIARERGIPTIDKFFGLSLVPEILAAARRPDLIIGNNVLAHVPQVNDFLSAVRECLSDEGSAVFEFPYVGDLLAGCEFDTIYHEHVFYYSLSAIAKLACRANLFLADVEHQPVHGGSLRVFLTKREVAPSPATVRMLADEVAAGLDTPAPYRRLASAVSELKLQLVGLLRSLKRGGHRIACYGAPAKGAMLLNYCVISTDLISFTVDRSPHKQGRLMPGCKIPILHPDSLLIQRPDDVLILPWNIADEIAMQQQAYLRGGGRFIVPIPEPRFLEAPMAMSAAAR